MAIHSNEEPEQAHPIDIEAWTEQTTVAFSTLALSREAPEQGAGGAALHIPLDDTEPRPARVAIVTSGTAPVLRRKEPLRRDSMKRREALLKGKEGSRRRQRWENDRLLNNPHAEPPTPKDWEIRPTHPVQNVPYYLAPLWDAGLARQSTDRKTAANKARSGTRTVAKKPTEPGVVPKELREKLKKARGAKGLLMDIEAEVRRFVERFEQEERQDAETKAQGWSAVGSDDLESSDDEEIVFVGRNGQMRDVPAPTPRGTSSAGARREMMVLETPADDQSFARWLVHHVGTYYGLRTWSVTRGAVREAYIGFKEPGLKDGRTSANVCLPMPRPLWGLI